MKIIEKLSEYIGDISNYNQSQYILGQMGRYVAWAGSGTPAAATGT